MHAWQLMPFKEWLNTLRIDNMRRKIKMKEEILEFADDVINSFIDREKWIYGKHCGIFNWNDSRVSL